jgi:hypothetical protein
MRAALEQLIANGFRLPSHVAVIGVNGSFMTATDLPAEDGLRAQVHSRHGEHDFKAPVNVMFVDSRAEGLQSA